MDWNGTLEVENVCIVVGEHLPRGLDPGEDGGCRYVCTWSALRYPNRCSDLMWNAIKSVRNEAVAIVRLCMPCWLYTTAGQSPAIAGQDSGTKLEVKPMESAVTGTVYYRSFAFPLPDSPLSDALGILASTGQQSWRRRQLSIWKSVTFGGQNWTK